MKCKLVTDRPLYDDLINNYQEFHNHYSESDLLNIRGKWEDDSDYGHYPTIEELLENVQPEDLNRDHTVTVDIKDIFSSEDTYGGCDRPLWSITDHSAKSKQYANLNKNDRGYNGASAQTLSGILRPHPTIVDAETGKTNQFQLVKYIGNNRVAMKLLANNGESTRVLMQVRFHDFGMSQKDYIRLEADLHSTDAGDRSGQNEHQKFVSSYRAQEEWAVHCFRFLRDHQFNYDGIMELEGVEGTEEYPVSEWLSLKSLQGLKDGRGNGLFKKYDYDSVSNALKVIQEISKITGEKVIGATPVEAFAMMYHVYTRYGKKNVEIPTPLFTEEELTEFFIRFFDDNNRTSKLGIVSEFKINDLGMTRGVKDISYLCALTFWPDIVGYWSHINDTKTGWSIDCHANRVFMKFSKDRFLAREIKAKIS